jgi:hypothetical protein
VNVRNSKIVAATINIEEVDVIARIGSLEILGVAKSLHEVVHSDLDGLGLGTIVVESATLSTELVPKTHHMSTGKRVGQQVDGVVPSHVPNYVLVGEDMGQNPKKLGVATPLWDKCEDETHTPKSEKLESFGTVKNSELD